MAIHRLLLIVVTIAGFTLCSGCASIISGRRADVTLSSNVPHTHVTVHDKHGQQVASVETPAVVSLKRKDRFIWPARYTATFEAQGYTPVVEPIKPTVNPWVVGNVVAGGVIGLAVDNVTGAAWKPKQDNIVAQMAPLEGLLPAPQVASLPPAASYSGQSPVLPPAQPANQNMAQPTSYEESVLPQSQSPGLQPSASIQSDDRPYGGSAISVGNNFRF
jgi:uncharacterized protein YceK